MSNQLEDEPTQEIKKRGRKPILLDNSLPHEIFYYCPSYETACWFHPFLEDIVTGATRYHLPGSTRPLRTGTVYQIVRLLPTISTEEVKRQFGYSESHSKKIAAAARVVSRECTKRLNAMQEVKPCYSRGDPEYDPNYKQAIQDRAEFESWLRLHLQYGCTERILIDA